METLYFETLTWMDEKIARFYAQIPHRKPVRKANSFAPRFVEKTVQQAIIQKLVRIASGLRATNLLLESGFLQERAALSRIINEQEDDVCFLALASLQAHPPQILTQYLAAFYSEEESVDNWRNKTRVIGRNLVSRRKILSYISDHSGIENDDRSPDPAIALGFAFSGYVHGASPHIMEMFNTSTNSFKSDAWLQSPFLEDHEHDLWNYYYRGIISFAFAAKSFGDEEAMTDSTSFRQYFQTSSRRQR